jgi:hypothetical protein
MGLMNYRLPGLFGLDEMDPRALAEYEAMRNVPPARAQPSPLARIWGTEGGLFIGGRGDPKGYTPPGPPYSPPLKLGRYPMPSLLPSYPPTNVMPPQPPPPAPPQRPDNMTAVDFPPEQQLPQVEVQDMPADPRYSIQPGTDEGFGSYQASAADFGEKQPQQGGLMSKLGGLFGGGPQNINLALLQAGLGTMAAGGWQKMPVTLGQAIGQGSIPAIGTHIKLKENDRDESFRRDLMAQNDELRREQIGINRRNASIQEERFGWEKGDRERIQKAIKNLPEPWRSMADVDPDKAIAGWAATLKPSGAGTMYERSFQTLRSLQDKVDAGQELTQQEHMEAATARALLSQKRQFIDPATMQIHTFEPLTVPSDITVGQGKRQRAAPKAPGVALPAGPSGAAGGGFSLAQVPGSVVSNAGGRKPLDAGTEKELAGFGDVRRQMADLAESFQDGFGGATLDAVGKAKTEAGRRLPESLVGKDMKQRSDWWMKYYNWSNDLRAGKFGLTLTANELEAFQKSAPKESDSDDTIRQAIKSQLKMLEDKINSRMGSLEAGGYNTRQAKELIGDTKRQKKVVRTGKTRDGKKVVQYEDGTVEYAE